MTQSTMPWATKKTRKRGESFGTCYRNFIYVCIENYINRVFECVFYCSDAIVNQVLDELGLQLADDLSGLKPVDTSLKAGPSKAAQPAAAAAVADADADLEARLANLKRQ